MFAAHSLGSNRKYGARMAHEKPGYLSPKELKEGIDLCVQNIRDIIQECNLLLSNGKAARALALSISAIEEMGKINVLRSINRLPKNKQKLLSLEWKKYFDHQYKSSLGFFQTVPDENRTTIESILLSAFLVREQAAMTEEIRQMALYTGYSLKKKKWHSPRIVDYDSANEYLQKASTAFERIEKMEELGLFDTDVLELEREMYKEVYDTIPDEPCEKNTLKRLGNLSKQKAREFYDSLIQIGKIERSDICFLE